MVDVREVSRGGGRRLRLYDAGPKSSGLLPVVWLHGTPNVGEPPEPLFAAAERHRMRWVSYDRPGYGGSTPDPGRTIASAAADVAAVADALGIERFAVMGSSGGGPHALGCAALLPERVAGVISAAGMAPFGAEGLDWFAGMWAGGAAALRASLRGRAALEKFQENDEYKPEMFTAADLTALAGAWAWMGGVAGRGLEAGTDGMTDDDLAYVRPWGFDPAQVAAPTLLLHGAEDRIVPSAHGEWLARHLPAAELWLRPGEGHVSVLNSGADALGWLRQRVG